LPGGAKLVDIGEVDGPTAQRKYLVRLIKVPRIGDRLYDSTGNQVALVRDVIGNVKRPMAVVEALTKSYALKGTMRLFIQKGRGAG
jgi:rRNA processing protein Gar1